MSNNTIKEDIHLIVEASKYSYKDRYKYLGDPDFSIIEIDKLLSKKYLKIYLNKFQEKKRSILIQKKKLLHLFQLLQLIFLF